MAILSNKGRVIESLANYPNPKAGDLLVIQDIDNNTTKNTTVSQLSQGVVGLLQGSLVNFTDTNNKFTGSFQGGTFRGVIFTGSFAKIDKSLNLLNGKVTIDASRFNAINFLSMQFGTTGAYPVEFLSKVFIADDLEANSITANSDINVGGYVYGGLQGNVTGSIRGDVFSPTSVKVLDNGTGLAKDAQFYGSASYAKSASRADHAKVADTTFTCISSATAADFATSALSSSYASSSRSSSFLRYTGKNTGTASYAMKCGIADSLNPNYAVTNATNAEYARTASYLLYDTVTKRFNGSASYALTSSVARSSSYARSASYSLSGSYARSASYAKSGSYTQTASYALSAASFASAYSELSNYNLTVVNPSGGMSYKKYFFYNQFSNLTTGQQTLMRINQSTGEVKKINSSILDGGRMALFKFNYTPPTPGTNESGVQDRLVYGSNSKIVVVSNLADTVSDPVLRTLSVNNGGDWRKYRCVHVDTSAVSGAGSPTYPTFYFWYCYSGDEDLESRYNYLQGLLKVYWTGASYHWDYVAAPTGGIPNLFSTNGQNMANYAAFANMQTATYGFVWSFNYNPVKRRLYTLSSTTGLVHIFKINQTGVDAGVDDIVEWWQLADSTTKYTYLTYEKSVLIPTGYPYTNFDDITDWGSLEYDTTTGKEKFWTINRYGIGADWPGVISKAAYWES